MLPQDAAASTHDHKLATGTAGHASPASGLLPNQDCALFRLPVELRDRIIEFAVIDSHSITIATNYFYPKDLGSAPSALSRTCHQLFDEVLAIYYKHNTFSLRIYSGGHEFHEVLKRLHNWLSCIGPAHRRTLGRIMICSNSPYEEHLQRTLADVSDSICTGGHWESKTVGRGIVRRAWEVGEGDVVYWTWDGQGLDEPCSDRVCVDGQCHYWLRINGDGHKEVIGRWGVETTLEYATPWHWLLARVKGFTGKRVAHAVMMATTTASTAQDSPLLALPPELRIIIYELAVIERYTIAINNKTAILPALARTCRQTLNEVRGVYYSHNVFEIDIGAPFKDDMEKFPFTMRRLHTWLASLGTEYRRSLSKMVICSAFWSEWHIQSIFDTVTQEVAAAAPAKAVLWVWEDKADNDRCSCRLEGRDDAVDHYWLRIKE
ncbi:hypothetical protein LTR17_017191 [Elasticomyces elasticus]|nr:hypothetical protein LTR17_017191 [Elasticomyces elasticus]